MDTKNMTLFNFLLCEFSDRRNRMRTAAKKIHSPYVYASILLISDSIADAHIFLLFNFILFLLSLFLSLFYRNKIVEILFCRVFRVKIDFAFCDLTQFLFLEFDFMAIMKIKLIASYVIVLDLIESFNMESA